MAKDTHAHIPVNLTLHSLDLQVVALRYFQGSREQKAQLVQTNLGLVEAVELWVKKESVVQIALVEVASLTLYELMRAGASLEELDFGLDVTTGGQAPLVQLNNLFSLKRKKQTLCNYLLLYTLIEYELMQKKVVEKYFASLEKKIEKLKRDFSRL